MKKTTDKILLGVLAIILVGMSSIFISALGTQPDKKQETNQMLLREITPEQARQIALNTLPGIFKKVELEKTNGKDIYEVEIEKDNKSWEVRIDFQGNIISTEEENEEEVDSKQLEIIDGIISKSQAGEIALQEINGRIIEVKAEREGGALLYEVEIKAGNDIAEVEIDATTGDILEIEWNEDDEDD